MSGRLPIFANTGSNGEVAPIAVMPIKRKNTEAGPLPVVARGRKQARMNTVLAFARYA
jgi:hypothetical protein